MKHIITSFLALLSVCLIGLGAPAYATSNGNPAGNNGVVKINNEIAPDTIPQNHPHVSCTFSVEFYNYDKGNYRAHVNFELQPPTTGDDYKLTVASGNLTPFIGGDAATGGTDLDAREQYKLKFTGDVHPQQGYHVKLTVQAPGSQGSDKKYKVFWVEPCKESDPKVLPASTTSATPAASSTKTTTATTLPSTGPNASSIVGISFVAATAAYLTSLRRQKYAFTVKQN